MLDEFRTTVQQALANADVAGGAAILVDKNGKTLFSEGFGKTSLDDNATPFSTDTALWIASSTKMMTSIAAVQCVEKGLLKLDEPIDHLLPEWKDPQILVGISEGKAEMTPATQPLTLRRLLTHSSGMAYPGMNPVLQEWRTTQGLEEKRQRITEDYGNLLRYEPGTSWEYSPAVDYAGKLVEKVTGQTLEEYMKANIWDPLGMKSTTFHPLRYPDIMKRMTGRVMRDDSGKLTKEENAFSTRVVIDEREEDFGGSGGYTTAEDYIKLLTSLLVDDGKLLKSKWIEEAFKPQLEHPEAFTTWVNNPIFGSFLAPGITAEERVSASWDHGLIGAMVVDGVPGRVGPGTLFWSGFANNFWFINRASGIAGFYASWIVPPGDGPTGRLYGEFLKAALRAGL